MIFCFVHRALFLSFHVFVKIIKKEKRNQYERQEKSKQIYRWLKKIPKSCAIEWDRMIENWAYEEIQTIEIDGFQCFINSLCVSEQSSKHMFGGSRYFCCVRSEFLMQKWNKQKINTTDFKNRHFNHQKSFSNRLPHVYIADTICLWFQWSVVDLFIMMLFKIIFFFVDFSIHPVPCCFCILVSVTLCVMTDLFRLSVAISLLTWIKSTAAYHWMWKCTKTARNTSSWENK